jgi:hypothetical protein
MDYGSTEEWEITLPRASRLLKSASLEVYSGRDPLLYARGFSGKNII